MNNLPTLYRSLPLIIALLLTGCGFHLRGWEQDKLSTIKDVTLNYTTINSTYLNNKFIDGLISRLRGNRIQVNAIGYGSNSSLDTTHSNHAQYTIEILTAEYSKKIISTGSTQSVTQYKLSFNTTFKVFKADKLILNNQVINAQRNYNYQANQILGINYEEDTIATELIQEVADRIMNQLILAKNK